jgi:peptide/nickel transport system substrate-binding protein
VDSSDGYLPTDHVERVEKREGTRVAKDETMRVMLVRMNNKRAPFDNVNFRRCLSHAFNYEGFIDGLLKGYVQRNPGPNPNKLWGNPKDLKGYRFDLALAKAECDKARAAGAPIDRELEIHTLAELEQTGQAAQLFQSDLRKLGLKVRIVPGTWPNVSTAATKAESAPDMWVHWVSTYFVDPENWVGQMYDSRFQGTWKASSFYSNPDVDRLLQSARSESSQAKRAPLYEEATRKIVADAADIWIYNTVQLRGLSKRVTGYTFTPIGSGSDFRLMSLTR